MASDPEAISNCTELAIQKLRRDYAYRAAKGDAAGIASLFTADGIFSFGRDGEWESVSGPEQIETALAGVGPNEVFPMIQDGPTQITGDTGSGVCMMFSPISPSGEAFGGHYEETYRRCNDGMWRFAARRFTQIIP